MSDLGVAGVRVFVPATDFLVSKAFYMALGWRITWSDEKLAVLEIVDQRFYLQNHYVKDWADNFMLHVSVNDAAAWHSHVSALISENKFPGVRTSKPKHELYGALVIYVTDPSGVLLHLAQWDEDA